MPHQEDGSRVPQPDRRMDSEHRDSEESLDSEGLRSEVSLKTEGDRLQLALISAGQRRVNLLWESTQALIAVTTVTAVLALAILDMRIPEVLQNMVFLIIGAYFSRTNHEKVGGVGPKPPPLPYVGR
jgi:hypothetical protein